MNLFFIHIYLLYIICFFYIYLLAIDTIPRRLCYIDLFIINERKYIKLRERTLFMFKKILLLNIVKFTFKVGLISSSNGFPQIEVPPLPVPR